MLALMQSAHRRLGRSLLVWPVAHGKAQHGFGRASSAPASVKASASAKEQAREHSERESERIQCGCSCKPGDAHRCLHMITHAMGPACFTLRSALAPLTIANERHKKGATHKKERTASTSRYAQRCYCQTLCHSHRHWHECRRTLVARERRAQRYSDRRWSPLCFKHGSVIRRHENV